MKCNIFDEHFTNRSEFMYHKKKNHTTKVQKCKNYQTGACCFADINCWFEHEKLDNANDKTNEEVMYNQNVIEKIFNLMETFSR